MAVGQRRGPHPGEVLAHHEVRTLGTVGVYVHLLRGLIDDVRRSPTLHAAEVEIRLVVDAPQLVGDELSFVIVEWGVGVHVDHGRHVAVVVGE